MTSNNLPALVKHVGGPLEKVVSEIEAYTDERCPLTRRSQIALARMIEDRPALNSEPQISMLVDILSHHGVSQRKEFTELVDRYGLHVVYLALEYLYEVGQRDRGRSDSNDKYSSIRRVRKVVELITKLGVLNVHFANVETLSDIVYQLGGLDLALDASIEEIESVSFQYSFDKN